jgi:hypothetical protein
MNGVLWVIEDVARGFGGTELVETVGVLWIICGIEGAWGIIEDVIWGFGGAGFVKAVGVLFPGGVSLMTRCNLEGYGLVESRAARVCFDELTRRV